MRKDKTGFSLLEALLSVAILVMLSGLLLPVLEDARRRGEQSRCVENLRRIGMSVMQGTKDNGNVYPVIETDPRNPVYDPEDGAMTLRAFLESQDLDVRALRCPADARGRNYFAEKESSYEWFPFVDGEPAAAPRIYVGTTILMLPPSRIPLMADYQKIHHGRQNVLFADGHIEAFSGDDVREAVWQAMQGAE